MPLRTGKANQSRMQLPPTSTTSCRRLATSKNFPAPPTRSRSGTERQAGPETVRTLPIILQKHLLILWPGGEDYGNAKAGTQNAETFYKQGVCAALDWGYNVFYFEGFDETWKPKSVGDSGSSADERHWGAFTDQRKPKWSISC